VITDRQTSVAMDVLIYFIHSFRMPVFFLLAGFFAGLLVEKHGLAGAWKNRAARVLAPLAAALVTILPLVLLFMIDFAVSVRYGTHSLIPRLEDLRRLEAESRAQGVPNDVFLGHLWFLYYLLYFYLLIPACRFLGEKSRFLAGRLRPGLLLAILGPYCALTSWTYRGAVPLGEYLFLTPHGPSLVYYGSFFVLGYLLQYHRDLLQALSRRLAWWAALGVILFPLALYLSHAEFMRATRSPMFHAAVVLANGFCTWTLAFFFVGVAMRYFDRPSAWALYASQSSYWVFLLHLPIVALVAWALVPYELPALAKFSIVVGVTTVACFVSYHYAVQRTWVSVFLNGRRFDMDWPWRAKAKAVAA
jgi:glucan biosynthesis protein C